MSHDNLFGSKFQTFKLTKDKFPRKKKRIHCFLIFQFFEIVFIVFEQVALKNCFGNILESKLKK